MPKISSSGASAQNTLQDTVAVWRLLTQLGERHKQPIASATWLLTTIVASTCLQRLQTFQPLFIEFFSETLTNTTLGNYFTRLDQSNEFYQKFSEQLMGDRAHVQELLKQISPEITLGKKLDIHIEAAERLIEMFLTSTTINFAAAASSATMLTRIEKSKSAIIGCFIGTAKKITQKQLPASYHDPIWGQQQVNDYYKMLMKIQNDCLGEQGFLFKLPSHGPLPDKYNKITHNPYLLYATDWRRVAEGLPREKLALTPKDQSDINGLDQMAKVMLKRLTKSSMDDPLAEISINHRIQQTLSNKLNHITSIVFLLICHLLLLIPLSALFRFITRPVHHYLQNAELRKIRQDFLALQQGNTKINIKQLLADLQRIEANPNIAERFQAYLPFIQVLMILFTTLLLYNPELLANELSVDLMTFILPIAMESIPAATRYLYNKGYQNARISSDADKLLLPLNTLNTNLCFERSIDKATTWDEVLIQVQTTHSQNSEQLLEAFDDTCIAFDVPLMMVFDRVHGRLSQVFLLHAKSVDFFNHWGSIDPNKVAKFSQHFHLREKISRLKQFINKKCRGAIYKNCLAKYLVIDHGDSVTLILQQPQQRTLTLLLQSGFTVSQQNNASYQKTLLPTVDAGQLFKSIFDETKTPSPEPKHATSIGEDSPDASPITVRLRKSAANAPLLPAYREANAQAAVATPAIYVWNINGQEINSNDPNIHAVQGKTNFQHPIFIMGHVSDVELANYPPLLKNRYQNLLLYPQIANARKGASGIVWQDNILKMKFKGAMGDYRIISTPANNCRAGKAKLFIFIQIVTH